MSLIPPTFAVMPDWRYGEPLRANTLNPHSPYLHAGIGAAAGWPQRVDPSGHSIEDTYVDPLHTPLGRLLAAPDQTNNVTTEPLYYAEFGDDGSAKLFLRPPRKLIGSFQTYADAQMAAKALNEAKGL